jgi:hypothetical protein
MLALAAMLAGCGGGEPGPAWRRDSATAAAQYYQAALSGQAVRADMARRRALSAAADAGRLGSLARLHLGRAAVQRALLLEPDFTAFDALAPRLGDPALGAYARLLRGRPGKDDPAHLPTSFRPLAHALLEGGDRPLAGAVRAVEQPRRRLIAAAVAHRARPNERALATIAVRTASRQGWRAALLAWLPVQAELAAAAGDAKAAQRARERLRWVQNPAKGGQNP